MSGACCAIAGDAGRPQAGGRSAPLLLRRRRALLAATLPVARQYRATMVEARFDPTPPASATGLLSVPTDGNHRAACGRGKGTAPVPWRSAGHAPGHNVSRGQRRTQHPGQGRRRCCRRPRGCRVRVVAAEPGRQGEAVGPIHPPPRQDGQPGERRSSVATTMRVRCEY